MDFIKAIEAALGKTAIKNFMDIQPGDVPATYADVDDLIKMWASNRIHPSRTGSGRLWNGIKLTIVNSFNRLIGFISWAVGIGNSWRQ
jgi:hypothetical protein